MKSFRSNALAFNTRLGSWLIVLFGIPRFLLVLDANRTGNYNFISAIFVLMWITPYILLAKNGRKTIGIQRPKNLRWLFYAFLLGAVACSFVYVLGSTLFQDGLNNWFVYISRAFASVPLTELKGPDHLQYFLMFAFIGMTFSPIGEELLYRGIIHQSFVAKYGDRGASIIDSTAFALVHLAHFGFVFDQGVWKLLWIPALLWMTLMFLSSRLFFFCKTRSGSIHGAIMGHAGFNFAMTYFIFYHIV
ncbi:MAG: CPBP family intramembrane metalloprotease [Flavobacteriales bacterium]|nr:MAG: CPBP family intramembrane metalloprotease [Flavobacteriales bacterium]